MIYLGLVSPFKSNEVNKLELFNTFMLFIVVYHLMCCTAFVPDIETREQIGMSYIVVVFIICLVSFGSVLFKALQEKIEKCFWRYRKWMNMKEFVKLQKERMEELKLEH